MTRAAYKRPDYARADRETLIERIIQLEDSAGMDFTPDPNIIRTTSLESKFLGALIHHDLLLTERAIILIYGMREEAPEDRIFDVLLTRLRRKLAVYGVLVYTVWGRGWSMSEADRATVKGWDLRAREASKALGAGHIDGSTGRA